jgi:hypothetical protein
MFFVSSSTGSTGAEEETRTNAKKCRVQQQQEALAMCCCGSSACSTGADRGTSGCYLFRWVRMHVAPGSCVGCQLHAADWLADNWLCTHVCVLALLA